MPFSREVHDRFELLAVTEPNGEAFFGWVAPGVLYSRYTGVVSVSLGLRVAPQLDRLLAAAAPGCRHLCDAAEVETYDFAAREALTRTLLSHKKKLASMIVLVSGGVTALAVRATAPTFGPVYQVVTDSEVFYAELRRVAPFAQRKLDAEMWVPVHSTTPPG